MNVRAFRTLRILAAAFGVVVASSFLPAAGVRGTETAAAFLEEEARLASFQAEATAAGALGFFSDEASGDLITVVPSSLSRSFDLPSQAGLGLSVRVQHREIDPAAIDRVYRRLVAAAPAATSAPDAAYAFAFDARSGLVRVRGTLDRASMLQLLGNLSSLVEYRQEDVSRLTRQNDSSPFWGGAQVGRAGVAGFDCTTGFSVKNASGTRFMVTAGHCFALNANVETGAGLAMGRITSRAAFPNRDMELIGTKQYGPVIYTGGADGVASTVKDASDPVVGRTIYCSSGAVTFERCDLTVTNLSAQFCDLAGCTPNLALYLPCGSQRGDSGSPFYLDFDFGGYPYIRGMVIAKDGDGCYAHKWSTIGSQFGVSINTG